MGGVYFSRDNAGLHIRKQPRVITREPVEMIRRQRNWYGALKCEEYIQGKLKKVWIKNSQPEFEGYEEPEKETTAVVYQLEYLRAFRKPSIFAPITSPIDEAGTYEQQLIQYIRQNYHSWPNKLFVDRRTTELLALRIFYTYWKIKGYTQAFAELAARINILHYMTLEVISTVAEYLPVMFLLLALGFFTELGDFLAGHSGRINFTKRQCLIRKKGGLFWGELVGRPSKKMFDFALYGPTGFNYYTWEIDPTTPSYRHNSFKFHGYHTTPWRDYFFYYAFNWDICEVHHKGWAYEADPGIYRMNLPASQQAYWGVPIGWYLTNPNPGAWTVGIEDRWS